MSSRGLAWLLLVFAAGCTSTAPACGPGGESFEDELGRYCAYAVIEGGFLCPAHLPYRVEFGTGMAIVCTDRDVSPEELPASVCDAAGYRCEEGRRPDRSTDGGAPDAGPMPLPAASCAPECSADGPPPPPGLESESTCYDGCNWCLCTDRGPINCTARDCLDAGEPDAGP